MTTTNNTSEHIFETLDPNLLKYGVCPFTSAKTIDNLLLVNRNFYNELKSKPIMKYFFRMFWRTETITSFMCTTTKVYKDELQEGEQLFRYLNTKQLYSKKNYKDGKLEGERLEWWVNGNLSSKEFYKEGNLEGEPLDWHPDGQLRSTDGKE